MRHPRRRRASRLPRVEWASRPTPLRGMEWNAGAGLDGPPDHQARWRVVAVVVALLETVLLGWLIGGSYFQVRQVVVTGNQRLSAAGVRSGAGLDRPGSVFAVDAATIRRKLTADAWIRDAQITASMPDRVDVAVDEWQPVAVFVPGGRGRAFFLSDQGAVLGPAPSADAALEIDAPTAPDPKPGQRPIAVRLLKALVNIKRGLPDLVGQDARAFEIDGCGNVTMTTQKGWKAYFGRVITPEEFATLDSKLGALKAVSTQEDLNSPDLEYVNLMNPSLPATGHKAKPAPSPSPSPARTSSPAPAPSPSAITPVVTCR
jgi:cell division septal protein FtsQ